MNDIVERLRRHLDNQWDEAADEIERLRAVLKRIATDDGINGYSANPELWPSTVAANALGCEQPSGEDAAR